MLVTNSDPKILYVHIPKTGGTSFENWIEKSLTVPSRWHHKNINHLYFDEIEVLTKRRFSIEEHYKFTLSRNPYDRFHSTCLHIHRQFGYNIENNILEFIKSNKFECTHKFDTMTNYIKGGDFEVFRYEEYPQVVQHFKDKFGFKSEPEIDNSNNSVNTAETVYPVKELKYLKIYENNRKLGTIVNELYAEDFKNFDYKMIPW
jgi:hypothetical protein